MITHDRRWSLSRGNTPVPSRWQATSRRPVRGDPGISVAGCAAGSEDETGSRACDPSDPGAVTYAQIETGRVIGEIPNHIVGGGKVGIAVGCESQRLVIGQQGVPVHAELQLGIGEAGVGFIIRDKLTVPREGSKERSRRASFLHDQIIVAAFVKLSCHLKACGASTNH
jgi:hypothetical protein